MRQNPLHILGQGIGEDQRFSGGGMLKGHAVGMQRLPVNPFIVWVIQVIPHKRKTEILQVNADLMGTARLQEKLEQAVPIFFCQYTKMCHSGFATCEIHGSLDDRAGLASQRCANGSAGFSQMPPYDSQVFTVNFFACGPLGENAAHSIFLATIVSPEVSRSRRLQQRKTKGLFCWS